MGESAYYQLIFSIDRYSRHSFQSVGGNESISMQPFEAGENGIVLGISANGGSKSIQF